MATRRTPIKRTYTHSVTPELRAQIERLIALNEAHLNAIRDEDSAFYSDGRHQELLALVGQAHPALGIRPWDDGEAKLAEALQ